MAAKPQSTARMSRRTAERERVTQDLVEITERLERAVASLETHVQPRPPTRKKQ